MASPHVVGAGRRVQVGLRPRVHLDVGVQHDIPDTLGGRGTAWLPREVRREARSASNGLMARTRVDLPEKSGPSMVTKMPRRVPCGSARPSCSLGRGPAQGVALAAET